MVELHLALQYLLIIIWGFVLVNLIQGRRVIPLNILGVMLPSTALMLYIIITNMLINEYRDDIERHRWEWYAVDILIAIVFNKVINTAKKVNKVLDCMSKVKLKKRRK